MLAPLRVYSEYSLLKSSIKTQEAIDYCKKNNIKYLGLANENSMFGSLKWTLECKKNNIKPILGAALKLNKGYFWAYCLNEEGFKELSNKMSDAYMNNLGSMQIQDCIFKNCLLLCDLSIGKEAIIELQKNNSVHLAISRQKRDKDDEQVLFNLSNQYNLPLIAAPKFFYANKEKSLEADCLWCIKNNTYIQETDRDCVNDDEYFKETQEYEEEFKDIPWALENSVAFAQKCNFQISTHAPRMPKIGSENPVEDFKNKVYEGFKERLEIALKDTPEDKHDEVKKLYNERVEYEIAMISKMNFCEYFLIVSNIVHWAKNNNILVGPGRGSGASSFVAYCLKITNIDPIKYKLMFERFLNPDRVSLPDFDIDFCQENRHRIIEYIKARFGKENVAHIITFGSLQYRAALRDTGRVLQLPYSMVDMLCKKLPPPFQGVAPTLKELRENKISTEIINSENEELFRIAENIEGLPRHCSIHAAGVVIGNIKLSNIIPLYKEPSVEMPIIQYAMKDAEAVGLVKFDILGLAVLSTISKALEFLKRKNISLDINHLNLKDKNVFDMLSNGMVNSVFQLDSPGFQNLMKEMKPHCFEDIIAAGALYRPGPMADIPQFVACKNGKREISYSYPELESILEETYGVTVYQEQVLQIAKEMAGYSLKDADLLRRAMGKKIHSEMEKHKEIFIKGILENCKGTKEKAETLFDNLARFASYGFAKAHATPYGMMTYQTAYLKYHYPLEFYCATMYYEQDLEKVEKAIQEARKMKVKVNPPCVNTSSINFDIINNEIYFGLGRVKGIGDSAKKIIEEREKKPFTSIQNFISRVNPNKRVIENLIYSGAFDYISNNRAKLFNDINNKKESNNFSLFDNLDSHIEEWSNKTTVENELSVLCCVFSNQFLKLNLSHLNIFSSVESIQRKSSVYVFGIKPITKKNKDGKVFYGYMFLDINGIYTFFTPKLFELNNEEVIIECEYSNNRYTITNISTIEKYLESYKKVFVNSDKKINLPPGKTSIFNFDKQLIGNFKLNMDFLEKNKDIKCFK